ncbi:hypothetical protein HYT55_02285 [Candidatus Woesearchaeota archaeon]|nr:hypothetical protein [Candidatus Woesearchaeota archaeon]
MLRRFFQQARGLYVLTREESREAYDIFKEVLRCQQMDPTPALFRGRVSEQGLEGVERGKSILQGIYRATNTRLINHTERPESLYSWEAQDVIAGTIWKGFIPGDERAALAELLMASVFGSRFLRDHDPQRRPYQETFQRLREEGFIRPLGNVYYLHRSIDQFLV